MTVHIVLLGREIGPIVTGLRHHGDVIRIHVLHSPNLGLNQEYATIAKDLEEKLVDFGYTDITLWKIDAFSITSISRTIRAIADIEQGREININLTGGTNLMAAVSAIAAFVSGARAYYVLDERFLEDEKHPVVELTPLGAPMKRELSETQHRVLAAVFELSPNVNSAQLREKLDISPQVLSYHLIQLQRRGLITAERGWSRTTTRSGRVETLTDSRVLAVDLTDSGWFLINFLL